jgi:hypothetical protein
MSSGYTLTALAAVQPGTILSDELLDRQGHVLLPQGAVLTDAVIASLARHGIAMVPVLSAGAQASDPEQVQTRLDHLFRKNGRDDDQDWATGLLRRYVEDYRHGREVAP